MIFVVFNSFVGMTVFVLSVGRNAVLLEPCVEGKVATACTGNQEKIRAAKNRYQRSSKEH